MERYIAWANESIQHCTGEIDKINNIVKIIEMSLLGKETPFFLERFVGRDPFHKDWKEGGDAHTYLTYQGGVPYDRVPTGALMPISKFVERGFADCRVSNLMLHLLLKEAGLDVKMLYAQTYDVKDKSVIPHLTNSAYVSQNKGKTFQIVDHNMVLWNRCDAETGQTSLVVLDSRVHKYHGLPLDAFRADRGLIFAHGHPNPINASRLKGIDVYAPIQDPQFTLPGDTYLKIIMNCLPLHIYISGTGTETLPHSKS